MFTLRLCLTLCVCMCVCVCGLYLRIIVFSLICDRLYVSVYDDTLVSRQI